MDTIFSPSDLYVGRRNEVNEISTGLIDRDIVLIVGAAGIGKTVLSKIYASTNPLKFSHVNYFQARQFDYDETSFSIDNLKGVNFESVLTIIDGLDEIPAELKRDRLLELSLQMVKYGHKIILTTRPYRTTQGILNNPFVINLEGLSNDEALLLFQMRLGKLEVDEKSVKEILNAIHNSPLGIAAASELLRTSNITSNQVIKQLYNSLRYENVFFENQFPSRIILPEIPQIITDIKIINSSLISKVKKDPNYIYSMSPRQFEEFVAELFEKDGYNVSLTQQTHDGGKDMFIVENKRLGKFIYYVECKKYSPDFPVGVRLVRELYGTVTADRATAGLLVTSSYFSKEAIKYTEQVKTQIALMEFADLKNWILESPQ